MARPRTLERPRARTVNLDDYADEVLEARALAAGVSVSQVVRDLVIESQDEARATLIAQLRAKEEATEAENRRLIREIQEAQARAAAAAEENARLAESLEKLRVSAEKQRQLSQERTHIHSPLVERDPAERYARLVAGFFRLGWADRIRPLAEAEANGRQPPDPSAASLVSARRHAGSWTQLLTDVEAVA